jgi:MFS family permease
MKFLKTVLIILCALLVVSAILCGLLSIEVIKRGREFGNGIEMGGFMDFLLSAGITFFVIVIVYTLIYAFVLYVNFRSVKKGRGRFFNIYSLVSNIFLTIYWVPFSIAALATYDWSLAYITNLFVALMICIGFILLMRLVYSIAALVCSNKNERDLDKEKEDRLVQRIAELGYHNPYAQNQNPNPQNYFAQYQNPVPQYPDKKKKR